MPTVHRQNLLGNLLVSLSASSMDQHVPWTRIINSNTSRQQSPLSLGTRDAPVPVYWLLVHW